ncbi:MAG: 4Fe-4S binding protein [bacterium]
MKKIRVAVSLIFFISLTLLFLDYNEFIPAGVKKIFTAVQFIPALLKFITLVNLTGIGLFIVLVLTILFGRVYCSSICPLGTLQDIVNFISKKLRGKKKSRTKYDKPNTIFRLTFLILSVASIVSGELIILYILDPYSNYGRIVGNLFRPVFVTINNLLSSLLVGFDVYSVSPIDLKKFALLPIGISAIILGIVFLLSFFNGRLFCNSFCPIGTLLGYMSKFSLFKVRINKAECLSCGVCEFSCKSNCINSAEKYIDTTRCVDCFNCLTVCPTEGIKYSARIGFEKHEVSESSIDVRRRNFIGSIATFFLSSSIIVRAQKKIDVKVMNKILVMPEFPISPPGAGSIERFNSLCTACNLCVSTCPTQVLQPSFLEYGFTKMLQPRMDNLAGFCNYECNACTEVCPTGALLPLPLEKKKLTQLGIAVFLKENCIVLTQKTECGACSEHCPTKAVHMIPYYGLRLPEVRIDYCIGCGACEYACPTVPNKAIYVDGNKIHTAAKKPAEEKPAETFDTKEEFPF